MPTDAEEPVVEVTVREVSCRSRDSIHIKVSPPTKAIAAVQPAAVAAHGREKVVDLVAKHRTELDTLTAAVVRKNPSYVHAPVVLRTICACINAHALILPALSSAGTSDLTGRDLLLAALIRSRAGATVDSISSNSEAVGGRAVPGGMFNSPKRSGPTASRCKHTTLPLHAPSIRLTW